MKMKPTPMNYAWSILKNVITPSEGIMENYKPQAHIQQGADAHKRLTELRAKNYASPRDTEKNRWEQIQHQTKHNITPFTPITAEGGIGIRGQQEEGVGAESSFGTEGIGESAMTPTPSWQQQQPQQQPQQQQGQQQGQQCPTCGK